jgi:hydroxyacylglutathione hydrolase
MINIKQFTFNPVSENTYILFDETGECVIIDPGMYDAAEQNIVVNFIKEQELKPVLLLNTHCHYDHVFGNKFVYDNWGLKPQFHKGELYVLQAMPGYVPQMGLHYELSPEPEVFLPEAGKVNFGNSQLELIFAPGHSSIGRTDLPGGNHLQLINSIKNNLFILPDDCRVYPGHGQSTTIGFEKQHNPYLQ